MAHGSTGPHIASLLDSSAVKQAGLTIYSSGKQSKPAYLSYNDLRALASQKADLLRCHGKIHPGKVVLIHFKSQIENIIWFWAAIAARCIPALSTPLVNDREGRLSHLKHLHSLLLDPVVITQGGLASSDFAGNELLYILGIESLERPTPLEHRENAEEPQNGSKNSAFHSIFDQPRTWLSYITGRSGNEVSHDTRKGSRGIASESCAGEPVAASSRNYLNTSKCSLEDVGFLMLTSGSTGNAKAVCISHKQVFAAISGKLSSLPLSEGCALLNWIGFDHVASMVEIHLCAMQAGLNQVHVAAGEVIKDPLLFLRLLSEHRVSRTFAPNFFLCKLERTLEDANVADTEGIDLRHLTYIASGGEPNNVKTCAALSNHLQKLGVLVENVITPGFGMTETCAGAIFNRDCPSTDLRAKWENAALGKCVPGIEMRVSPVAGALHDMDTTLQSDDSEGALEIKGPIVFQGYFNDSNANQAAFTSDGWFKTGDLAIISANGDLRLIGRSKELMIINGVKYLPQELEAAINEAKIEGVSQSFVACFAHRPENSGAEEIYVIYQREYDPGDTEARIIALHSIIQVTMVFSGCRPRVLPLGLGRLEKSTLGKLSRTKIQASLKQGHYEDEEALDARLLQAHHKKNYSAPENHTERTLITLLSDVTRSPDQEMGIDTFILDTGITSVDLIRLKSMSEAAFNISDIPIITFLTKSTIRSLAPAIDQLQTQNHRGKYNPVITLQHHGSKDPLWLIHPGIGEVLVFFGLIPYFADRPIYGLRARGFNQGELPFTSLTDAVATYFHALKKQQPDGPYALAGYSYGSMLAFEIAKILEANGDTVQFLGSLNLPPHIKDRMQMLDWTAGLLHIAHFTGIITEHRSEELVEELRGLSQERQVAKLLAESDQQRCAELALTHASLWTWTKVAWSLQKIGWKYDPSGSVSRLDVFYCQPLKVVARTREEYRETKLRHWADFVREPVRFHEVDGQHYTMIGPDHVPTFQARLKDALAGRGL
ncbi:MAG: putative NRPS-like protein biosynthetic cluster [Ramalina farinacea]|uniref:NRPS-like protein biosynthetic cluster n=1 Tax=Ramalina farinacea TaxID=258253 RepID=A0AA43QQU0_9LECA|nr:putative NRPS-like protein biosynthetic cluster [Ramalina farinacea]